jgi:hypothetical protein
VLSQGLYVEDGLTYVAYYGHDVTFLPFEDFLSRVDGPYPTVDYIAVRGDTAALPAADASYDLGAPQSFDILFTLAYSVDTAAGTETGYVLMDFVPGEPGLSGNVVLSRTTSGIRAAVELSYDGIHPVDGSFLHVGILGGGGVADEGRIP